MHLTEAGARALGIELPPGDAKRARSAKAKAGVTRGKLLADKLIAQVAALGFPGGEREVEFDDERGWRLDVVFGDTVAVEIDGGGYVQGRHSRGKGMEEDRVKWAQATIAGFVVMPVTPSQVESGDAALWVAELLRKGKGE